MDDRLINSQINLILIETQCDRYYFSHYMGEETEPQRYGVIWARL